MTTTAKTKRTQVVRLTKKRRVEELWAFVQLCLASIDPDPKEVANATGLSLSTIYSIKAGGVSLYTRCGTLQALGIAAGLRLEWSKYGAAVRIVD